ncbi:hypothetical protein KC356_g138 [Hortaea werneckii]|nr:hypothetical protein KC356_g138 [Hortaea werneckii]
MLATSTTTCLLPRPTITNPQIDRPSTTSRTRALHSAPSIIQIVLPSLDILMDPLRHPHKSPLDIIPALRARLDVLQHAIRPTPLLGLFAGDLSLVLRVAGCDGRGRREVGLVANQDDDDVVLGDLAQVVEPGRHGGEGVAARDVEDEQGARGSAERDSFMCFCCGCDGVRRLAGGPTGTMREPNSTPILSSSAWSVLREI